MARNDADTRLVYSTGGDPPEAVTHPEHSPGRAHGPSGTAGTGRSRGVRLRLDRRASGRVVTLIDGLPGTSAEISAIAKQLRAACGTGGSVKDGTVELQGDQRDKVEAFLGARGNRSKRAGG